ncbi:hypothetical protein Nepgr_015638 [Nepenthes gracilis]|uniref:Uncharacterized protein n=1 Tax=Nepenthes gracilis TaxID=150966 RepID=A0AAD3XQJ6_NEPGR|nr:hypothetical protein Nepgr_015638 [Nepenthes gracilis]
MAGEEKPTFLVTPATGGASSVGDSCNGSTCDGFKAEKAVGLSEEVKNERGGGGHDQVADQFSRNDAVCGGEISLPVL